MTKAPSSPWLKVIFLLVCLAVPAAAQIGPPPDPYLESYEFLETNWISDYGYLPLNCTNLVGVSVEGENALMLDTTNLEPAFLQYNVVETDGHTNLDFVAGAVLAFVISDWASADTNQNGQGPGELGYLLGAGDWSSGSPQGFWAIYVDAGGTNIYFGGVSNSVATTYVSAPISWASNSIHMIGLTYTNNSAFYLDGQLAATGGPVTIVPATNTWTNGLYIGSDASGYEQFRGIFLYVELDNSVIDSTNYESDWGPGWFTCDWSETTNYYDTLLAAQGGFQRDASGSFKMPPTPTNTVNTNYAAFTNFWLQITNTGGKVSVNLINPAFGLTYVIMTNARLTPITSTNWQPWITLVGSNTVMSAGSLTSGSKTMFFNATLVWETGTNNLPDWWQMEYFGQLNVNPYADPDGDGLCNLSEYMLGTNPTNAHSISSIHTDAQAMFLAYTNDPACRYHLAITNGSDGNTLFVTMSPTQIGTNYQIYSQVQAATNGPWIVETNFLGTNIATTVAIYLNGRTISLIGGYGEDSDGDGLPDGYEVLATLTDPYLPDTGMTGVPDGYKDPDGDGYVNLQEYYNGTDPHVYNPGPGPAGLAVNFATDDWGYILSATLTWNPSPGNVQSYTILAQEDGSGLGYVPLATVGASQTLYVDTISDFYDYNIEYELVANYPQGSSLAAGIEPPPQPPPSPLGACLVSGPNGALSLALLTVPNETTAILLVLKPNNSCGWGNGVTQSNTIPISSFTNGLYALSATEYPFYTAYTVSALAVNAASTDYAPVVIQPDCELSIRYPFLDGSQVLQDNMVFNLQAQSAVPTIDGIRPVNLAEFEGLGVTQPTYTTPMPAYAVGSYRTFASLFVSDEEGFGFQETARPLHPWEINAYMFNFIYQPPTTTCGFTNAGEGGSAGVWDRWETLLVPTSFGFDTAGFATSQSTNPCPSMLGSPTNRSINNLDPLMPIGGNQADETTIPNAPNAFGLVNQGSHLDYWSYLGGYSTEEQTGLLSPGSSDLDYLTTYGVDAGWEQYQAPQVQAQFYQFTTGGNLLGLAPDAAITNAPVTNVLIAGVADPNFSVSGWLRYRLLNGYPGIYGYVEQYFDKAYMVDTNGNITTNQTGVLSPYGYFFPTQPGTVALITRTNIETGGAGTAIVNVIRLSLDANHDGFMDETSAGQDNTTTNQPYTFWANNDYDRYTNGTQEDLESAAQPDCNYTVNGNRVIPCTRDLEDFARLWISGITTNLISSLPANYHIYLSWGDTQSWPNSANPTIDLFQAADPDGGTGYLTNGAIATNQINTNLCRYVGRLGPGGIIELNDCSYSNCWAGSHFIWCGVAPGNGALTLNIAGGRTVAYIKIVDIKQMYERWTVGDSPDTAPGAPMSNAVLAEDNFSPGYPTQAFQYPTNPGDETYIVYVHGWNMASWEKDRYAETMYKRLYWQGYHGRFGSFRWPCNLFNPAALLALNFAQYNIGERTAWQCGQPFETFLTKQNGCYPGNVYVLAHSMGNVVTAEALRLAGTNVVVNTYVATQAAISARAYDNNIPADATNLYTPGVYTPDSEGHYYTNVAPPYFNGIAGAGTFVDYYNQLDYALSYWVTDQNLKADSSSYFYTTPSSQFPSGYYNKSSFFTTRSLVFPTNTYEIFSMAAQSYSFALGAETNIASKFPSAKAIDLNAPPYSFGRDLTGHSFQFHSDNMTVGVYWHQLLSSYGIIP